MGDFLKQLFDWLKESSGNLKSRLPRIINQRPNGFRRNITIAFCV